MKIELSFKWYDLWIGAFWDSKGKRLYICPLPCIVIMFQFSHEPKPRELSPEQWQDWVDYERNLHQKTRSELDSCMRAWHDLINQGEDFYSWQRDWQDGARQFLNLGQDASVDDIRLALLLREKI